MCSPAHALQGVLQRVRGLDPTLPALPQLPTVGPCNVLLSTDPCGRKAYINQICRARQSLLGMLGANAYCSHSSSLHFPSLSWAGCAAGKVHSARRSAMVSPRKNSRYSYVCVYEIAQSLLPQAALPITPLLLARTAAMLAGCLRHLAQLSTTRFVTISTARLARVARVVSIH
eukprot:COSAG02_NODE_5966_length_3904_cov_4.469648_4_plen_173_part_00